MFLRNIARRASRFIPGSAGPPGALILVFDNPHEARIVRPVLEAVLESGAPLMTLSGMGKALERGRVEPGSVCLAFEGDLGCWSPHLDWLLAGGGRATLFALGAGVSDQPGLPTEVQGPLAGLRRMPLDALRALAGRGLCVGCLSITQRPLAGMDPATLRIELFDARRVLVEALGCPVPCLSYPGGNPAPTVVHMAASVGYRVACGQRRGYATARDNPLLLPRLPVRNVEQVRDLLRGTDHYYHWATARIRHLTRRDAGR